MVHKKFAKGFIGSIGDDLPSLVPLFFALMLFFTALGFAFTTINERNATINTYVDSLTIARAALGDGSFADINEFKQTQANLVTLSNYFYGLIYIPKDSTNGEEFNLEETLSGDLEDAFIGVCDDGAIGLNDTLTIEKSGQVKEEYCDTQDVFFAASNSVIEKLANSTVDIINEIKNRKYFSYLYPVTLLTPKGYMVVYLLVLVW